MVKKLVTTLCICAIVSMLLWQLTYTYRKEKKLKESIKLTSDSKEYAETVTIQGDEWVGYMVFTSKSFKDSLAANNIGVKYEIEADSTKRVSNLEGNTCQLAAMTIDSWLSNGSKLEFPGVIGFVIDESTGGDVIIGGPKVRNIDNLNNPELRGVFVENSPSEFFLKSTVNHFHIVALKDRLHKFKRDNIQQCTQELANGKADFAVLWEPYATTTLKALPRTVKILDTAQTKGIVVDVCIFGRKFLQEHPKTASLVCKAYFTALHELLNNPEELRHLAATYSKLNTSDATRVLAGVTFATLDSNRGEWFGSTSATSGKLFDTIDSIGQTLVTIGDFKEHPVAGNPYTITNRKLVGDLQVNAIPKIIAQNTKPIEFKVLTAEEWETRTNNQVGTLIEDPILFTSGSTELTEESEQLLQQAVINLQHYPTHRVVIAAGVAPGNDAKSDQVLSQGRAEAIRAWLIHLTREPETRFLAQGVGATTSPQRIYGESTKAWELRCRFAKIYLVTP